MKRAIMSRLKANRHRPLRIARDLPTILHRVQSEQSEHFVNVFLRSLKA